MSIQPAICTICEGVLEVSDVDLNGFCECKYCRTPHRIIDVITIDGLPTVKNLLTTAGFCIKDGKLEKAEELYKDVINIKANCHEAWWGLYLCNSYYDEYYGYEDKYGNRGTSVKVRIISRTIEQYARRAIEYAPKAVANKYMSMIQKELEFIKRYSG